VTVFVVTPRREALLFIERLSKHLRVLLAFQCRLDLQVGFDLLGQRANDALRCPISITLAGGFIGAAGWAAADDAPAAVSRGHIQGFER
jgi:hypothetical protein